jgi:hypothetical protein
VGLLLYPTTYPFQSLHNYNYKHHYVYSSPNITKLIKLRRIVRWGGMWNVCVWGGGEEREMRAGFWCEDLKEAGHFEN